MKRLSEEPGVGLASESESGWTAALEFTEEARRAMLKINDRAGRAAVVTVQLHSAPSLTSSEATSSLDAFSRSLEEIVTWDWQEAKFAIEHCDALAAGHAPEKGFLPLTDEIIAVLKVNAATGSDIGITINWDARPSNAEVLTVSCTSPRPKKPDY